MTDRAIELPWTARTTRPIPFAPPEIFTQLRNERPLRPMTFAGDHQGWLATGYPALPRRSSYGSPVVLGTSE